MGDVINIREYQLPFVWKCGGCGSDDRYVIYEDGVVQCSCCGHMQAGIKVIEVDDSFPPDDS